MKKLKLNKKEIAGLNQTNLKNAVGGIVQKNAMIPGGNADQKQSGAQLSFPYDSKAFCQTDFCSWGCTLGCPTRNCQSRIDLCESKRWTCI